MALALSRAARPGFWKRLATAVALAGLVGSGCAGPSADAVPTAESSSPPPSGTKDGAAAPVQPILVNSVLTIGSNRLTVVLLDNDRAVVHDATILATLAPVGPGGEGDHLAPQQMTSRRIEDNPEEHGSHSKAQESGAVTIYTSTVDFPSAGKWQLELDVTFKGAPVSLTGPIEVLEQSAQPAVGSRMPSTKQSVLADVSDLSAIDTSRTPDEALHDVTVAQALTLGRPVIVAFATPSFCQTRVCGPVVEGVLRPLQQRYGDRVEVIHIEPFDVPMARSGQLARTPAMGEWGLSTEPWVFVADSSGRIVARFEGPLTLAEVEDVLRPMGITS
ncbi:MAG: hypothetical protein IT305_12230 [Chloroflexi bacterium]|nr:hypothetical protein [Chloroflexota bacterium]